MVFQILEHYLCIFLKMRTFIGSDVFQKKNPQYFKTVLQIIQTSQQFTVKVL